MYELKHILETFCAKQITAYLQFLETLPRENRPKAGPDLVADFLEYLMTK